MRGYGLVDSDPVDASPGDSIDLRANATADAELAARGYPAAYWYAMLGLPSEVEVDDIPGGLNHYLMWMKNMACVGCHQMGQAATRTMPPTLADHENSEAAWVARISAGQAGNNMTRIAGGLLKGIPYRSLAAWTDQEGIGS